MAPPILLAFAAVVAPPEPVVVPPLPPLPGLDVDAAGRRVADAEVLLGDIMDPVLW